MWSLHLQANALLSLGLNSARIGGAALGGLLIAFTGPGWGLAVDALSFALAGVFFAFVRVPDARVAAEHKPSVLAELKVGWTEFVSRQWVWVVVVAFTFVVMRIKVRRQLLLGVAWETALQHHVPADRLARVYSYDMLGSFVAIPLAQLAIGPVSHAFGTSAALLGCAAIYLLATAGMLASRSVRSVENVPEPVR